ncbi:hypothetical protein KSP40_PGU009288 [Platanthera guangdongensis]|uniref:Calmodulin-binding domain-containing protein n=1 Tax=Platanthera guangdongensis TaxID=2320717 RepID=A0ABR2LTM1_9ASPA
MIPSSNPSKKLNREEKSMKLASTEAPIQASTCLKSKEKLQVRIDSSSSSSKIKNTKNSSQNSISPRPASPNSAAKDLEKSLSLKPLRSPMKKNSGAGIHHTMNLSRATSSTAIKVARNSDSLELNEPKVKLCTYSYCSLHNQKQEAPLPVVKCFLRTKLSKRQSFEVQNRMNQKKKSSGSKNDQNTKGAERSGDEVEIVDIVCRINGMMLEDCDKSNQLQDSYSVTSFEDYDEEDKNSEISMEEIEVFDELQGEYLEIEKHGSSEGETNLSSCLQPSYSIDSDEAAAWPYPQHSLQKFDDFLCHTKVIPLSTCKQAEADSNIFPENEEEECKVLANGSLQSRVDTPKSPKLEVHCDEKIANSGLYESSKHESQLKVTRKSNTDGDISDELACEKEKITNSTSLISKNPLTKLSNSPKAKFNSTMRRIPTENHENNAREFNPGTPRFLPPKTEAAAAEKVNLKHQPMEERKTAEEWMIDYALRQTLRRMSPARKRKVSLLVAAFESVIQQELKMS